MATNKLRIARRRHRLGRRLLLVSRRSAVNKANRFYWQSRRPCRRPLCVHQVLLCPKQEAFFPPRPEGPQGPEGVTEPCLNSNPICPVPLLPGSLAPSTEHPVSIAARAAARTEKPPASSLLIAPLSLLANLGATTTRYTCPLDKMQRLCLSTTTGYLKWCYLVVVIVVSIGALAGKDAKSPEPVLSDCGGPCLLFMNQPSLVSIANTPCFIVRTEHTSRPSIFRGALPETPSPTTYCGGSTEHYR